MILLLPAIIIGLTFHEFAHGWVAYQFGDDTAKRHGRLTLNPIAHIDPLGFIMLMVARFGWAKPVPVNPYNMRVNPKKGMLYVSLAGPLMNFILAVIAAVILRAAIASGLNSIIFFQMIYYMVFINLVLAVFNLIPVPPLDGSKILSGLLPGGQEWLAPIENYGIIILLILVFTGFIGTIIRTVVLPLAGLLTGLPF
ncbi:MAG: site-2 protease family protein [Desulfotomaculaceae bacterium]